MGKYTLKAEYDIGMKCYELESEHYTVLITKQIEPNTEDLLSGLAKPKKGVRAFEFTWFIDDAYTMDPELSMVSYSDIDDTIRKLNLMKEEIEELNRAVKEYITEAQ